MGLRPKRAQVAIANLGLHIVKKPRLAQNGPRNKENFLNVSEDHR